MPTLKKPLKKTTTTKRTSPRIESTEDNRGSVRKSATHRGKPEGIEVVGDGTVEIVSQASELVPVAQYASVTVGPISMRFRAADPGIEQLADVDWSDDPDVETKLTPAQQAVFDRAHGLLYAGQRIVDSAIARDRALIEESVRLHNEREAEEEAKAAKKPAARRKSS